MDDQDKFTNEYYQLLHQALDALVADFVHQTGKLPGQTPIYELMSWSSRRTPGYTPDHRRLINYSEFLQEIGQQG
jgi:hypothetical protein